MLIITEENMTKALKHAFKQYKTYGKLVKYIVLF